MKSESEKHRKSDAAERGMPWWITVRSQCEMQLTFYTRGNGTLEHKSELCRSVRQGRNETKQDRKRARQAARPFVMRSVEQMSLRKVR